MESIIDLIEEVKAELAKFTSDRARRSGCMRSGRCGRTLLLSFLPF